MINQIKSNSSLLNTDRRNVFLPTLTLQIHRSDTPSIDAVIDRFATTAARRL